MYYFLTESDNKQHKTPHIHVKYQGEETVFSIPSINSEEIFKIDHLK